MTTREELRSVVREVLAEAKKKKEKSDDLEEEVEPGMYSYSAAFDFSAPLGGYNLYRQQGAVNWGPMTSAGSKIDDRVRSRSRLPEKLLRGAIRAVIEEELDSVSAWDQLSETFSYKAGNIWEGALHWYDFQSRGLGERKHPKRRKKSSKQRKKS